MRRKRGSLSREEIEAVDLKGTSKPVERKKWLSKEEANGNPGGKICDKGLR